MIGNALSAFTQAKQAKSERDTNEKYKKAMTQLLEAQIEQAQRQNQARTNLQGMMTTPVQVQADAVPTFSYPDNGELGQSVTRTPSNLSYPRNKSLSEILADPAGNIAALESGLLPQLSQLDQFTGRENFASGLESSGQSPMDFLKSPQGGALAVRAGAKPDDFMRMFGQGQGGGLTTDIQNYTIVAKQREAAGLPPISFEDYQQGIRQNSELSQAYKTYVAQSIAAGKQPEPLETFAPRYKASIAGAETTAKANTERLAKQIDEGYRAADALPIVARGIELLNTVQTGGIDAVKLQATNLFGVTGADEAELSANLGKAVLSQLRSTFGAQFTEAEGRRLSEIEAGFGKSTAGNRRLLEQAQKLVVRVAERGIAAARQNGSSYDEQALMKAMQFSLSDKPQGDPLSTLTPEQRAKYGL